MARSNGEIVSISETYGEEESAGVLRLAEVARSVCGRHFGEVLTVNGLKNNKIK